jgi:type VI secretion system secreted protein Hcp
VSIYVKSDDIPGPIEVKDFEKTFEVDSISYGVSRMIGSRTGVYKADSKLIDISDFALMKRYDSASTKLLTESFAGKLMPKWVISLTRQDNESAITYCEITLEDVVIASYSSAAANGGGEPTESISLSFGKITVKNTPAKADGTAGTPASTGWNRLANTKI